MFGARVDTAAAAHAERHPDVEAAGLVVDGRRGPVYRAVANVHETPATAFRVDPETLAEAADAGVLRAVVHSHVGPAAWAWVPSEADMRAQEALGVPWGLVVVDGGSASRPVWFGDQAPVPPLLGRPFRWGVTDCYALVRDWFRLHRPTRTPPSMPRAWGWWERPEDGPDPFLAHAEAAGFTATADAPRCGDIVLLRLRPDAVSHCAVVVRDGVLAHHPGARTPYAPAMLSREEPLARWAPYIQATLRSARP